MIIFSGEVCIGFVRKTAFRREKIKEKFFGPQETTINIPRRSRGYFIAIDVAKNKHDGFILNSEGTVLADVFTIPNNLEGFNTTYQSGQLKNCYPHMEKRGSRYLRYALYNAAKYVCHWEPTFAAYLTKKKAEGKHYNVALSHAAKKLVRLIFTLEKSRQPYCPTT